MIRSSKSKSGATGKRQRAVAKAEVVIIAAEEFRRLTGSVSGEALIKAMQASPYRDISITPDREPMPVRDISL